MRIGSRIRERHALPDRRTAAGLLGHLVIAGCRRRNLRKPLGRGVLDGAASLVPPAFRPYITMIHKGNAGVLTKNDIGPHTYRDAMAHFAGAVHVAATDGVAGRRGATVIAACSVSDSPPTVLVCLNRENPRNDAFLANGAAHLQQDGLAHVFADERQRLEDGVGSVGGLKYCRHCFPPRTPR